MEVEIDLENYVNHKVADTNREILFQNADVIISRFEGRTR